MIAISRTRTPLLITGEWDDEPTQPIPAETMRELVFGFDAESVSDGVPLTIEDDAHTEPVTARRVHGSRTVHS